MSLASRLVPFATLSLIAASALADAPAAPDGQWHGGVSLGAAMASGNTESRVFNGTADTARATTADKITLYGVANYANSKINGANTTTANLLRAGGRYDYNLTDDIFVFGGAEGETNKAGGLKDRFGLNAGAGYKVIRGDVTTFDVFGGVGYDDAKYTDDSKRKGAVLVLGEESTHKLTATTSFKQRLALYPGLSSDVGNRANFDAGLATAITGGWTLNLGLSARYASKTPVGIKSTDTLLTAGFGYKF